MSGTPKRELRLDGAAVDGIASLYDELNRLLMTGVDWRLGASLDALDDVLHGGYGAIDGDEPVRLVLVDDARLRAVLGAATTRAWLAAKLDRPDVFDAARIGAQLAALDAGTGPDYYALVREVVAGHPNIEVVEA